MFNCRQRDLQLQLMQVKKSLDGKLANDQIGDVAKDVSKTRSIKTLACYKVLNVDY